MQCQVHAFEFNRDTGSCKSLGYQSAQGTSTCYLTLDKQRENLLLVNYWDSTVNTMPISPEGVPSPVSHMHVPKGALEISK